MPQAPWLGTSWRQREHVAPFRSPQPLGGRGCKLEKQLLKAVAVLQRRNALRRGFREELKRR